MDDFERLKVGILSDDPEIRLQASDSLAQRGDDSVVDFLISLLENENPCIRDVSALALREIKDNRAVDPLTRAIQEPRNRDNRGTLVYALETLDCSRYCKLLVQLALYGNYEVQCHALTILQEQKFSVSKKDIKEIYDIINSFVIPDKERDNQHLLIDELKNYIQKIKIDNGLGDC